MFRHLPYPYESNEFPAQLAAVVQRTVLDGVEPAREVAHWSDGSWTVADGVSDPNLPGAAVATHIAHAVARNSSLAALAAMQPGRIAQRAGPDDPWRISVFDEPDD
jgi:hypothetical protein